MLERLLGLTDISGDCWIWFGRVNHSNYGTLKINKQWVKAHRLMYELFVGDVPKGLELDHLCRVHSCVNPAHLEPVTRRENVLRGESPAAKFARRTHCSKGHEYSSKNTRISRGARLCKACLKSYNHDKYLERTHNA